jgi:hypothetical protein
VVTKKHKPAPDMDRATYKGLVHKSIKDRLITYTASKAAEDEQQGVTLLRQTAPY